jgi:aerobic carbon-monoxide dehydrogenase medium subunit
MSQSAYAAPAKLEEAVLLLANNPGSHVLAGGQGLLVEPRRSQIAGSFLVDLRKVTGLSGIEPAADGGLLIRALTTLGAIAASDLVRKACPVLADAAGLVGDAQVRNRATLGGTLAEADPGSDLAPVLLVLGSVFHITGPEGSRGVQAEEFFRGPGRTALSATEVITGITIRSMPWGLSAGAAYEKMKEPATLYALCGVAASVTLSAPGLIGRCRVAATGSTEYPVRLQAVERALTGARPDPDALRAAASRAGEHTTFRDTFYASSEYRAHLTRVLTERVLQRALARAAA